MRQKGLVKLLVNLKFCEETFIRSKRVLLRVILPRVLIYRMRRMCSLLPNFRLNRLNDGPDFLTRT